MDHKILIGVGKQLYESYLQSREVDDPWQRNATHESPPKTGVKHGGGGGGNEKKIFALCVTLLAATKTAGNRGGGVSKDGLQATRGRAVAALLSKELREAGYGGGGGGASKGWPVWPRSAGVAGEPKCSCDVSLFNSRDRRRRADGGMRGLGLPWAVGAKRSMGTCGKTERRTARVDTAPYPPSRAPHRPSPPASSPGNSNSMLAKSIVTLLRNGETARASQPLKVLFEDLDPGLSLSEYEELILAMIGAGLSKEPVKLYLRMFAWGVRPTVTMLNAMAEMASVTGDAKLARHVYKHLVANGEELTSLVLERLIGPLIICKDFEGAIQLFKNHAQSLRYDGHIYEMIVRNAIDADKPGIGLDFFHECVRHGVPQSTEFFTWLIEKLCRLRRLDDARHVYRAFKETRKIPKNSNVYTLLAAACVVQGDIAGATQLLDDLPSDDTDSLLVIYGLLMEAHLMAGDEPSALQYLNNLNERNIPITSEIYMRLIYGYSARGPCEDPDEVLRWYDTAIAAGHAPTRKAYLRMMALFGRRRNVEGAEVCAYEMERLGMPLDVKAYTTLIAAYGKARNVEGAVTWFRKMKESGIEPDIITHGALMGCFALSHQFEQAEEVLQSFLRKGKGPGVEKRRKYLPNSHMMNQFIDSLLRSNNYDVAEHYLEVMASYGVTPDRYISVALLTAHARRGDAKGAMELFYLLRQKGTYLHGHAYTALLYAIGKGGSRSTVEMVDMVMADMKAAGVDLDLRLWCTLMFVYIRLNHPKMAIDLWDELPHIQRKQRMGVPESGVAVLDAKGKSKNQWALERHIVGAFCQACVDIVRAAGGHTEEGRTWGRRMATEFAEIIELGFVPDHANWNMFLFGLHKNGMDAMAADVLIRIFEYWRLKAREESETDFCMVEASLGDADSHDLGKGKDGNFSPQSLYFEMLQTLSAPPSPPSPLSPTDASAPPTDAPRSIPDATAPASPVPIPLSEYLAQRPISVSQAVNRCCRSTYLKRIFVGLAEDRDVGRTRTLAVKTLELASACPGGVGPEVVNVARQVLAKMERARIGLKAED
ncbi:hypothetical protein HK104_000588 [Borealophlyctis nickersoniae]|nr:hypothetical protein HK104_000588 [Borealophlyctis nickersoniae]